MFNESAKSVDMIASGVRVDPVLRSRAGAGGVFTFKCYDKDGNLKWEEANHNLVVNVGLKDMNDKYFSGATYTATWYIGLITGPAASTTFAAGDTASSHAGWTENTSYSQSDRPQVTFGAATTADPSVISNSGSPSTFSINNTATIAGAFLISNNTKGGTTGILFSESDFQSPGDRSVVSGDTLTVTYQFSLDAA
jgi:hypothetical protein